VRVAETGGSRERGVLPIDPGPSPSQEAVRAEERAAVQQALDRLPEHYAQVLRWHSQEQLPFAEIALRLGKSEEAARKLFTRALEALKRQLESPP
jgi:RNA polymerase sigma-70 factor (ECF subfamily)